jgi:hypothetical protein
VKKPVKPLTKILLGFLAGLMMLVMVAFVVGVVGLFGVFIYGVTKAIFSHQNYPEYLDFSKKSPYGKSGICTGGITWGISKGWYRVKDGKLILKGNPGKDQEHWGQFQNQSRISFATLEIQAESDQWAPDTSLGFEFWGPMQGSGEVPY